MAQEDRNRLVEWYGILCKQGIAVRHGVVTWWEAAKEELAGLEATIIAATVDDLEHAKEMADKGPDIPGGIRRQQGGVPGFRGMVVRGPGRVYPTIRVPAGAWRRSVGLHLRLGSGGPHGRRRGYSPDYQAGANPAAGRRAGRALTAQQRWFNPANYAHLPSTGMVRVNAQKFPRFLPIKKIPVCPLY